MIKSKIEAREKAMELAMPLAIALLNGDNTINLVSLADEIKDYIIGDAELPEFIDDNDNFKTLIDIINQEMVAFRKQGNDNLESLIKTLEERENGAMALTCKADAE